MKKKNILDRLSRPGWNAQVQGLPRTSMGELASPGEVGITSSGRGPGKVMPRPRRARLGYYCFCFFFFVTLQHSVCRLEGNSRLGKSLKIVQVRLDDRESNFSWSLCMMTLDNNLCLSLPLCVRSDRGWIASIANRKNLM